MQLSYKAFCYSKYKKLPNREFYNPKYDFGILKHINGKATKILLATLNSVQITTIF
jgi:hypothetical protein